MSLLSRVSQVLGASGIFAAHGAAYRAMQGTITSTGGAPVNYCERYAVLRAYYANNGLYDILNRGLYEQGFWSPALKGLRNPA